jgi:hypothetical protein
LNPKNELAEDIDALRRFGRAVVRDNWLIFDERSAWALVETLSRQAMLAAQNGEASALGGPRVRLFSLFIRFYRRHVRMAALEDGGGDMAPHGHVRGADGASALELAIRNLPLELRESLLLVVLERFSHIEAAQALDLPLTTLMERLTRARGTLAIAASEPVGAPMGRASGQTLRASATHLRLVK